MIGEPKFKVGDKVCINIKMQDADNPNNGIHIGEIYIVDPFGTYFDDSDVSYDILVHDFIFNKDDKVKGDCLMKHWNEKLVQAYVEDK